LCVLTYHLYSAESNVSSHLVHIFQGCVSYLLAIRHVDCLTLDFLFKWHKKKIL